jgi:sugar lactone lactonase YvrE
MRLPPTDRGKCSRRPRRSALLILAFLGSGLAGVAGGQAVTEFPTPTANSGPLGIAAGPDGNLWFVESGVSQIGRITTAGVITEFPIPTADSAPVGITSGPGGLWFTDNLANKIGRITTAGGITEFSIPTAGSGPAGIAAGPDGNLWFTEFLANRIARIDTAGNITEFRSRTRRRSTLAREGRAKAPRTGGKTVLRPSCRSPRRRGGTRRTSAPDPSPARVQPPRPTPRRSRGRPA